MLNPGQQAALATDKHISLTAGAGTGKTSVLVERYLRIIETRAAASPEILALTFTEKAAAEMKARVKQAATEKSETAADLETAGQWEQIIEDLQDPEICTFHALCAKLLREFPIEAGVDPAYSVQDESESAITFQETLETFLSQLSETNDQRLAAVTGIFTRRKLHAALSSLHSKRANATAWAATYANLSPADSIAAMKSFIDSWLMESLDIPLLQSIFAALSKESCEDENDKLFPFHATAIDILSSILNKRSTDLSPLAGIDLRGGKAANWNDIKSLKETLNSLRDYAKRISEIQFKKRDETAAIAASALGSLFLEFRTRMDTAKGDGLILDFDDLEEKTLALLQNSPSTGAALRGRYKFILVDEFQDTNETQWKIIRLLASAGPASPIENNIFIVGDEKQSIYAFRGANVAMFDRARRELQSANSGPAGTLELEICYRSHPELLRFFNAVFPPIFRKGRNESYLPEIKYTNLLPERPAGTASEEPRIEFVIPESAENNENGDESSPESPVDNWQLEAAAAAERIRTLLTGGETITTRDDPAGRPLRPGDIAILFRSRTRLPEYQEALKNLAIPFNISGGMGFYDCREVMDLVNIIGFLAHPCDDLNLAGALRSPHICVSDEDLLAVSTKNGKYLFDKLRNAASDEALPGHDRIQRAYTLLSRWKHASGRVYIAELLCAICRDTGIFAITAAAPAPESKKLNIEKLITIARSFEQRGNSGVARFSEYIEDKIARMERESEAAPAEQSIDAVNIMTVHAAKGLEFPVVFIAGISSVSARDLSEEFLIEEVAPGRFEAGFTVPDPDNGYASKPSAARGIAKIVVERKHEEEQKRLLYVACTRAKDKLIFCGARPELFDNTGKPADDAPGKRWDGMLAAAIGSVDENTINYIVKPIALSTPAPPLFSTPASATGSNLINQALPAAPLFSEIIKKLPPPDPGAIAQSMKYFPPLEPDYGAPARVSVTDILSYLHDPASWRQKQNYAVPLDWQLDPPHDSEENSLVISPLLRGSIVHKLFENIATIPPGGEQDYLRKILNENGISDEQAAAEFETHYLPRLKTFAESQTGREIAASESHRELNFSMKIDSRVITGVIDLVYGSALDWTIIDYKTDLIDTASINEKDTHYRLQLEIYALAVLDAMPQLQSVRALVYYIEPSSPGELLIIDRQRAAALHNELAAAVDAISSEPAVDSY